MADILIKNIEMPLEGGCHELVIDDDGEVRIYGTDVVVGEAVALPDKHGKIVDIEKVIEKISLCFAECKLKNIKVTKFILATYMAQVPAIVEASK